MQPRRLRQEDGDSVGTFSSCIIDHGDLHNFNETQLYMCEDPFDFRLERRQHSRVSVFGSTSAGAGWGYSPSDWQRSVLGRSECFPRYPASLAPPLAARRKHKRSSWAGEYNNADYGAPLPAAHSSLLPHGGHTHGTQFSFLLDRSSRLQPGITRVRSFPVGRNCSVDSPSEFSYKENHRSKTDNGAKDDSSTRRTERARRRTHQYFRGKDLVGDDDTACPHQLADAEDSQSGRRFQRLVGHFFRRGAAEKHDAPAGQTAPPHTPAARTEHQEIHGTSHQQTESRPSGRTSVRGKHSFPSGPQKCPEKQDADTTSGVSDGDSAESNGTSESSSRSSLGHPPPSKPRPGSYTAATDIPGTGGKEPENQTKANCSSGGHTGSKEATHFHRTAVRQISHAEPGHVLPLLNGDPRPVQADTDGEKINIKRRDAEERKAGGHRRTEPPTEPQDGSPNSTNSSGPRRNHDHSIAQRSQARVGPHNDPNTRKGTRRRPPHTTTPETVHGATTSTTRQADERDTRREKTTRGEGETRVTHNGRQERRRRTGRGQGEDREKTGKGQGEDREKTGRGQGEDTPRTHTAHRKDRRPRQQAGPQRPSSGKLKARWNPTTAMRSYVRELYPNLQKRVWFVPPIHFNVARRRQLEDMREVYVPEVTPESNSRADEAHERVLEALKEALVDRSALVLSGVTFEDYLNQRVSDPSDRSGKLVPLDLPRSADLPPQYRRGEVEMLVVDKAQGILIVDIKAVGDTFQDLQVSEGEAFGMVRKVLEKAVVLMRKSRDVVLHLVSDIPDAIPVKVLLALPNLRQSMLHAVLEADPELRVTLQSCLMTPGAVPDSCLCADHLPAKHRLPTDSDVTRLSQWWTRHYPRGADVIDDDVYETLFGRFCGPFSAITSWSAQLPRTQIRTLAQAVRETANRLATRLLLPEQQKVLECGEPRVCVVGPPGAGKTVVLTLKGVQWAREGRHVCVLSARQPPSPAALLIHSEIQKMLTQTRHTRDPGLVDTDVLRGGPGTEGSSLAERLTARAEGRDICLILHELHEEATPDLLRLCGQVPDCRVWASGLRSASCPPGFVVRELVTCVRCPPSVQRVLRMTQPDRYCCQDGHVKHQQRGTPRYVTRSTELTPYPLPTSGPPLKLFSHAGHGAHVPVLECPACAESLAALLKQELEVGKSVEAREVVIVTADSDPLSPSVSSSPFLGTLQKHGLPLDIVADDNPHRLACPSNKIAVIPYPLAAGLERAVVIFLPGETASDNATCARSARPVPDQPGVGANTAGMTEGSEVVLQSVAGKEQQSKEDFAQDGNSGGRQMEEERYASVSWLTQFGMKKEENGMGTAKNGIDETGTHTWENGSSTDAQFTMCCCQVKEENASSKNQGDICPINREQIYGQGIPGADINKVCLKNKEEIYENIREKNFNEGCQERRRQTVIEEKREVTKKSLLGKCNGEDYLENGENIPHHSKAPTTQKDREVAGRHFRQPVLEKEDAQELEAEMNRGLHQTDSVFIHIHNNARPRITQNFLENKHRSDTEPASDITREEFTDLNSIGKKTEKDLTNLTIRGNKSVDSFLNLTLVSNNDSSVISPGQAKHAWTHSTVGDVSEECIGKNTRDDDEEDEDSDWDSDVIISIQNSSGYESEDEDWSSTEDTGRPVNLKNDPAVLASSSPRKSVSEDFNCADRTEISSLTETPSHPSIASDASQPVSCSPQNPGSHVCDMDAEASLCMPQKKEKAHALFSARKVAADPASPTRESDDEQASEVTGNSCGDGILEEDSPRQVPEGVSSSSSGQNPAVVVQSLDSRLRAAVESLSDANREKLWLSASRCLAQAVIFHF